MTQYIDVIKFAEFRAREITTLLNEVTSKEAKLNIQKLPHHMRRRAASHNPKRLPKHIQMKNIMKSGGTTPKLKKKRKCHEDLLEEYNKRQKVDNQWLSTHIWFAKRFHMKKMWGYQLPTQATGKRFRSSYRATVRTSLVQDMSYYCCIEIKGSQKALLPQLARLTSEQLGGDFSAASVIDGTREGSCFLYHPSCFPYRAIGPVSFIWKPCLESQGNDNLSNSVRQLWIWCHPTIHDELVQVLIDLFQLELEIIPDTKLKEYTFASKVNYMKTKLHFQKEKRYANGDVSMMILKDTLIRQRIIGPNALSIISSILNPLDEIAVSDKNGSDHDNASTSKNETRSDVNDEIEEKLAIFSSVKYNIWKSTNDSYFVPPRIIIGLTVYDPRLYITYKKSNTFSDDKDQQPDLYDEYCSKEVASSALWDKDVRDLVTASQIPEHELNKERMKYFVPEPSELKYKSSKVPMIIIHQPGSDGYGSGWDIIAPQGWGMALWIPLIYHGAQPSGVEDSCYINLESNSLSFPYSFPDTAAGAMNEEKIREENLKKYYKYPRSKRPNFTALGINTPFFVPWEVLTEDWEREILSHLKNTLTPNKDIMLASKDICSDNFNRIFFVLRNARQLANIRSMCMLLTKRSKSHSHSSYNLEELKGSYNSLVHALMLESTFLKSLVPVKVKNLYRGVPSVFSRLYFPTESDLITLKENYKYYGPVESNHSSSNSSKDKKLLKEEAKKESKVLNRPQVSTITSSSDRKTFGYITEGGYSRLNGQGIGIGHCTLTGLVLLLELCIKYCTQPVVLMREQHSFQYRFTTIEIINPM